MVEHSGEANAAVMRLPPAVVGPVDIGRLHRELTALDEFLSQAALRHSEPQDLPRTSKLLEELSKQNTLNLLDAKDRQRLREFIQPANPKMPVLHMSFAADPSPVFLNKLVSWLRTEIHPLALLQIGLQPSIAAGCVLRTTNKYFDFSLRKNFTEKRGELIKRLEATKAVNEL